jgi:hypothetical protein
VTSAPPQRRGAPQFNTAPRRSAAKRRNSTLRFNTFMKPAEQRLLAQLRSELDRVIRYDDESVVHPDWTRQRYAAGGFAGYGPARAAAVRTAWHEAGHAVAALAVGAAFSSASIRPSAGHGTAGRVRGVTGGAGQSFVIDAGGQVAEALMDWTLPATDDDLRAWLAIWRRDGGDARRFRRSVAERYRGDEVGARRLAVRQVARALLVHPRHLPYPVVAALAGAE